MSEKIKRRGESPSFWEWLSHEQGFDGILAKLYRDSLWWEHMIDPERRKE